MQQITDLINQVSTYLDPDQIEKIEQAYHFGARAHEGQKRVSGEPYIYHPVEVASILADIHMDHQTISAALLHDVIEDTSTVKREISREFGKNVAELVDGVSKLTQITFDSVEEAQAHNFRKMLMAMSSDIRVILVKLADRLHNMRTLDALRPDKRRRIARETLEIYVPIAQRLGLNNIRLELEELGFSNLYPMRHRILAEQVRKARGHRKEIINRIRNALRRRLRQEKIPAQVIGREKHLYGIYQKMKINGLSFNEVYDVYAFRIIVDSVNTCYRVVGTVHNLYKPVPGKFKDYIAIPKSNGYQSLHTILFGPFGVPIEVQIRTHEMNDVAESGIAAHWLYKSDSGGDRSGAHKRARKWLQSIIEMQQTAGNPEEFLENVKVDLFPDAVYAFTPKGKIIELPRGATAVDFAYAIHSNLGNECTGVRINRRLAPLSTQIESGQTIEIIKSPGARPNPAWLNFVVTAKARSNIRHFLKNLKQSDAIDLGKRLLNRQLDTLNISQDKLDTDQINNVLQEYKLKSFDDLLQEIGLGNRMAPLIARKLTNSRKKETDSKPGDDRTTKPFSIQGTEGMVVNFPKCCYPIPGDPIIGFTTSGRGIVIHTQSCKNIAEYRNHPEKWINVEWEKNIDRDFPVRIRMNATNQRGVLATVAAAIADIEANIINVDIKDNDDRNTTLDLIIEVTDRVHLANVLRRIRRIKHITHPARR